MNADESVFPLTLTPFEHSMFADDSSRWPMTCNMRLGLQGTIGQEWFTRAVSLALQSHPLLVAVVAGGTSRSATRRLGWQRSPILPMIVFDPTEENDPSSRPLDLTIEPGLRITVYHRRPVPHVLVQWHHATCDGLGMFAFLEEVFVRYRQLALSEPETLAKGVDELQVDLRFRGKPRAPFFVRVRQLPYQLSRIVRFFSTATISLDDSLSSVDSSGNSVGQEKVTDFHSIQVSVERTRRILQLAREHGVSANDWFIAAFYQALQSTFYDSQTSSSARLRRALRVAIPISLRATSGNPALDPATMKESAANRVSMIFMDRTLTTIANFEELLPSISQEMKRVKEKDAGRALIRILDLAGRVPGGMCGLMGVGGDRVTGVFSNLMRPFSGSSLCNEQGEISLPGFTIKTIEPFPPLRRGVKLGVVLLSYANQVIVAVHYDRSILDQDSADQFLNCLLDKSTMSSAGTCFERSSMNFGSSAGL